MPPEAKVFLVEDNPKWAERIIKRLLRGNHTLVRSAATLGEALQIVAELKVREIDVAVVDSNLTPQLVREGNLVAEALRARLPEVRILSSSGTDTVRPSDAEFDKKGLLDIDLAGIINRL